MTEEELTDLIAGAIGGGCAHLRAGKVLTALHEANVMPVWQPIESAPMDEGYEYAPDILVATEAGNVFVSSWTLWNGRSYQWCNGSGRELPSLPDGTLFDPVTHWQPLPTPPEN